MAYFRCKFGEHEPPKERVLYAEFTGLGGIVTNISIDTYKCIYVDFQFDEITKDNYACASTYSYSNMGVVCYGGYIKAGNGSGLINLTNENMSDRHVCYFKNKRILFDGVDVGSFEEKYVKYKEYVIGRDASGNASKNFKGRIYEYKVTDRTGETVYADIIPTYINDNGVERLAFYDIINNVEYTANGMTVKEEYI